MLSVRFPWCKDGSHRQLAGCLETPGCGFCHSPLTALFMLRVQTEALSSGGPSRPCVRMNRRGALTKVSMVTQRSVTHAAANVSHFPKVSVCLYVSVSVDVFTSVFLHCSSLFCFPPKTPHATISLSVFVILSERLCKKEGTHYVGGTFHSTLSACVC